MTWRPKQRSHTGISAVDGARLRASGPDQVCAIDYQFDQMSDHRTSNLMKSCDEFTIEALAIDVPRSITADGSVSVPEGLMKR